jgi:PAS domain S-box-containing protein
VKIRTQLIAGMAVVILIFVILSASVVSTTQQVERMDRQMELAAKIELDAYELNQLTSDYLLHHEDRQEVQWRGQYALLSGNLARLETVTPEQQTLAENIRLDLQHLELIFSEVSAVVNGANTAGDGETGDLFIQTAWSRMAIHNQGIITAASRLSETVRDDSVRVRQEQTLLVFLLMGAVLVTLFAVFFLINRRVLGAVSELGNGMRNAGSGNLDFRIPESGDDEFRYLATSFNAMTASRQAAEDELLRRHDELYATYEQLTAAEEELRANYETLAASEKAFAESEEKYRLLYDNSGDAILLTSPDGGILTANAAACEMFQRSEEEIKKIGRAGIVDSADPRLVPALREREQTGRFTGELTLVRKDGSRFAGEISTTVFTDRNGQPRTSLIIRDITNRTMMEEEIRSLNRVLEQRVIDRTEQLNRSLQEKEVLLKEIHHRVKNNLQIVASLFSLQSRYIRDESVLSALKESQNRVRAMALVHEKLYRSEDVAHINLTEYVRFLVTSLFKFYNISSGRVKITIDLEDVLVDIHSAIPIGLIVNELVSNSLKHAFPEGSGGGISISGRKEGRRIDLLIQDTGRGMPEGFDWRNADSLGLRLVIILTDQMGGTIEREPGPGTGFRLTLYEKT